MKHTKLGILFLIIIINGCIRTPEIVHMDYNYTKMLHYKGNHKYEFDISLENLKYSIEKSNLIKALIYDNKNLDEYADHIEKGTFAHAREGLSPKILSIDEVEYYTESILKMKYTIEYYDDLFIIIKYIYYYSFSEMSYGYNTIYYYIIDLTEKRTLNINDLLNKIPDDILIEIIETNYDITEGHLRRNAFPPDTVNFCNDNIELIWNINQIAPNVYGTITIEIHDEIIEPYLTEKGKKIKMVVDKSK
jgi:hypothetical protein